MRLSRNIRNSAAYRLVKLTLKRLVGRELWLKRDLSVATRTFGDWIISAEALDAGGIVYSLGVGDDIALDLALIDLYGVEIHAFDPTPASVDWLSAMQLPKSFHFHPWAVTATDGPLQLFPRRRRDGSANHKMLSIMAEAEFDAEATQADGFRLDTIMSRLGHDEISLLKMDIEGAEYDVLDTMLASDCRPRQLLIEFHHRFPGIGMQRTRDALAALRREGYGIYAISSTGREVSMIRDQHAGQ
jgi:FkbM family methyltransferase